MSLVLAASGVSEHKPHKNRNIHELKAARKKLHDRRAELTRKKHAVERRAHVVRRSIQDIDGNIGALQARLAATTRKLKRNESVQKDLTVQLAKKTEELQIRSEQARVRLRQIYMHGDTTLASAIIGSSSLADLASRKFVFERIAERDRELFESVRTLKRQVQEKKTAVEQLIVEDKQLIEDEKTDQAELQDRRQEKLEALQDLKGQEGQLEQLIHQLDEEDRETESEIASFQNSSNRVLGPGPGGRLGVPVYHARLASGFGMRYHPILHYTRLHAGQDFAAPYGSEIHAAANGKVIGSRYTRGYGNVIMVDHGGGVSTLYGHCSRILARAGQQVSRGEVIALVGATGLATGPHCHFEVRVNGNPVNPMGWLH